MSLIGLLDLLNRQEPYKELIHSINAGSQERKLTLPDSARPYVIAALWRHLRIPVLVLEPRPEDARRTHDQLLSYLGDQRDVYLFPEQDVLPFERLIADAGTNNQRVAALHALGMSRAPTSPEADHNPKAPLVVSSTSAAMRRTLPLQVMDSSFHTVETGSKISLAELFSRWVDLGYRREDGIQIPGTFSQRGGIVDVYSPSSTLPARIELWGDKVDSIRLFHPATQRSVDKVETISIVPARETLTALVDKDKVSDLIGRLDFSRCTPTIRERIESELAAIFSGQEIEDISFYGGFLNHGCLIDHLPEKGLLVLDRDGEIGTAASELESRAEELRAVRIDRGELPANFPSPQIPLTQFESAIRERNRLLVSGWTGLGNGFDFGPAKSYNAKPHLLAADVPDMLKEGRTIVVVSRNAARLSEVMEEAKVGTSILPGLEVEPDPGELYLVSGSLGEGWSIPIDGHLVTVLTDAEVFGTSKERRYKAKAPVRRGAFTSEMAPGSYVVHIDHGIARFSGTIKMESNGDQREYLVLEYAEKDKLYVPTEQLDRVSVYMASSEVTPSLTRLGTSEWAKVKERVKQSAKEMAQELLELYASRQVAEGHSFATDSPWQKELEDSFPYEDTRDQARTVEEVKGDMEQLRPMDRLVCGDVGYGKTEVALRSAFKAMNEGFQVAMLVPTTVLAQQHYATFSERLSPFPIRVEVLSRFKSRKEQQEVVEGLKLGTVDIVIGTHRLLQRDVKFKNLGLVVVDEEQRFGVAHKEWFKRLRKQVDMLTLSATPIPRTLYMGLSGIRDMSTMETPPEERLPIKTYVAEYDDELVKEAIIRELDRGGQVFYLHNRVRTIHHTAESLRRLVPQATIAIGHGRMDEEELERVMVAFSKGEIDVLVCTTIIESGLDIPNANTLIIDRADRFGLSQLYQLRGRVGRSSPRAYTCLLIPRGRRITEAAGRRLKAILEASELGAGFRIAMRDLEIRGAGNVLGAEQSGHIHAVGFELYAQLLNEAVAEIRSGEGAEAGTGTERIQARVNLSLPAHIPESYITHLPTRLAIYQRLTKIATRQELDDLREEMRDRFGQMPEELDNLIFLVDLKLLAGDGGVESVVQKGSNVTLSLTESVGGAGLALEKALGPGIRVGNRQIHFKTLDGRATWKHNLLETMERLVKFREHLETAALQGL